MSPEWKMEPPRNITIQEAVELKNAGLIQLGG